MEGVEWVRIGGDLRGYFVKFASSARKSLDAERVAARSTQAPPLLWMLTLTIWLELPAQTGTGTLPRLLYFGQRCHSG
jgi:hypothetical protein